MSFNSQPDSTVPEYSPIFPSLLLDRKFWNSVVTSLPVRGPTTTPRLNRRGSKSGEGLTPSAKDATTLLQSHEVSDKYITAATSHRSAFHAKLFADNSFEGIVMDRTSLGEVLASFGVPTSPAMCCTLMDRLGLSQGLDEGSFCTILRCIELAIASNVDTSARQPAPQPTPMEAMWVQSPPYRRRNVTPRVKAEVRASLKSRQMEARHSLRVLRQGRVPRHSKAATPPTPPPPEKTPRTPSSSVGSPGAQKGALCLKPAAFIAANHRQMGMDLAREERNKEFVAQAHRHHEEQRRKVMDLVNGSNKKSI